jgi:outer membrane protein OmpA-like peptidoglycan-associated protein
MLMTQRALVVPAVLTASFLFVGCATKKFVREEVSKSETKLGQEVSRVETDLGQTKTQVSGLAVQVTETRSVADEATHRAIEARGMADQASGRANEAADRAGQAQTKAEEAGGAAGQALAKAAQTDQRLTQLWSKRNQYQPGGDAVVIRFGFDKWMLDDKAETALLDVVKQLQENPNLVVQLEGYTDNVGPEPYNIQLSQRRAEAVRRFLVAKGIDLNRIQSIALGDIHPSADNKTKQGRDQNRRVAVRLLAPAD